jgi:hypothetical protein
LRIGPPEQLSACLHRREPTGLLGGRLLRERGQAHEDETDEQGAGQEGPPR